MDTATEADRVWQKLQSAELFLAAYPSADNQAAVYELSDRWGELNDALIGDEPAPTPVPTKEDPGPPVPTNFDELKSQVSAMREQVDDLHVEWKRAATEAKKYPPSDIGVEARVARREAKRAEEAAMFASSAAEGFRQRHDERLSVEKLVDDITIKKARLEWAKEHQKLIATAERRQEEAKREGRAWWDYMPEIEKIKDSMAKPPTAEFVAEVRAELIAKQEAVAQANTFDPEKFAADRAAAKFAHVAPDVVRRYQEQQARAAAE